MFANASSAEVYRFHFMLSKDMTRIESILNEVRTGVQAEMETTIMDGDNRFHYEKEYGDAYVDIEFREIFTGAFFLEDWDIHVCHEYSRKESPLLEKALKAVMPNWFETKERMQQTA